MTTLFVNPAVQENTSASRLRSLNVEITPTYNNDLDRIFFTLIFARSKLAFSPWTEEEIN
jgi:hypothetical protein